MIKQAIVLAAIGSLLLAVTAHAQLTVVNGDFNTGAPAAGGNAGDVADPWFDAVPANFWEAAWHINHDQPNMSDFPSPLVIFSGGPVPPEANYLYQNIGIRGVGDSMLPLLFELGSFTDTVDVRSGTLTISVYQSGIFVGANGIDVATSGATLIDSVMVTTGDLNPGDAVTRGATLDLGTANMMDPLFLRFEMVGAWIGMDNVQVIPEPSTFALGGLALALLTVCRRRRSH